jgi:hypothetical protein
MSFLPKEDTDSPPPPLDEKDRELGRVMTSRPNERGVSFVFTYGHCSL